MTVSEKKKEILLNINQAVVANLVDDISKLSVENEELKAKIAELTKQAATPPVSKSD